MASKKAQMNPAAEVEAEAAVGEDAPGETAAVEPAASRLVVRALKAGFRRAGRAWPAEEVTVSTDEFTGIELEQLLAEPMLVVQRLAEVR